MSYQVLARKWRPRRFSEMVGQQHVLKALENALNQNRLHHAYLFTGTRGVGKTTIARIFAKCLNCEGGISAEPCGSCSVCESVDAGKFLDLIEIDAASHTGVDAIRDLLENTQYSPTHGKYKVYLIDEVHMLSGSAFNALLKTLEEPPEHVKFLLATTDPQKLPVTVLSRCLQFNLKAMSARQIADHLVALLEKEMIDFESSSLELIAKAADGSMRDALSLTDQAIAHGNESLKFDEVRAMLGMVDRAYIKQIIDALIAKDSKAMLDCIENMAQDSPSYKNVLAELLDYLHRLIVEQVSGIENDESIKSHARAFTAEDLQLFYQVALKGRADLAISPDPRQGMEICLLRMLLFRPEKIFAPGTSGNGSAEGEITEAEDQFKALKEKIQKKKPEANSTKQIEQADDGLASRSQSALESTYTTTEKTTRQVSPGSTSDNQFKKEKNFPNNSSSEQFSYQSIPDKWTQIFIQLGLSGPSNQVARHSNFSKISGKSFRLITPEKYQMLTTAQAKKDIHNALNQYFGAELELDFQFAELTQPSPDQLMSALDIEKSQYAAQSVMDDDLVKILLEEYDANVLEGSAKLIQ